MMLLRKKLFVEKLKYKFKTTFFIIDLLFNLV